MKAAEENFLTQGKVALIPVCTLVLWLTCLAIGAAGIAIPYYRPRAPKPELQPVQAEILKVELTDEPLPTPDVPAPVNPAQPPPLVEPVTAPQAPPRLAVAEPSPAIAFPLPVTALARVVDAKQASYAVPTQSPVNAVMASARPPEPLTFGQGDGKQPAPEYPVHARRQGQEGSVTVRFSVGEDGRVIAADAISPSPWPLLNQAAIRVVRERWRFRPGPARLYEVLIRFELRK